MQIVHKALIYSNKEQLEAFLRINKHSQLLLYLFYLFMFYFFSVFCTDYTTLN